MSTTLGPAEQQRVVDVSHLPTYAFGTGSIVWWGTIGLIAIESTVFALAVAAYFYVWTRVDTFPPSVAPPNLGWGTASVLVMLASALPNRWTSKVAEKHDLRLARIGVTIMLLIAVALLAIRFFEFRNLNVSWDSNAYGSAVWMLLGLHTAHLVTDAWDTAVLAAVLYSPSRMEGKRFLDVSENGFYWYFVVWSWVPIYAVIYWAPRLLAR
jgi:heme/copper-type cytochrome/quinol oxidase subunit 3